MIKNTECCILQSTLVEENVSEWKTYPEFSITHQIKHKLCLEKTLSVPKAVFSTAHMETSHHACLHCNPHKTDIAPQERSLMACADEVMCISLHGKLGDS